MFADEDTDVFGMFADEVADVFVDVIADELADVFADVFSDCKWFSGWVQVLAYSRVCA
jgi:hypothetical protein